VGKEIGQLFKDVFIDGNHIVGKAITCQNRFKIQVFTDTAGINIAW
jgi:hypothetical protein